MSLAGLIRLRVVAYFLAGLVLVDVLLARHADLWRTYSPDDYQERLEGCRREYRDFIVIGGSPVSEGIDPARIVGLNWRGRPLSNGYSLGLPGGTTSELWHALEHGAPAPPRLLIYGITATDLNDHRNEPHGPYALMDWGDLAAWVRHRPRSREWVIRQFVQGRLNRAWQLFRYRDGLRLWTAAQADCLWPGAFPEAAREARTNAEYSRALHAGHGYAPNKRFRHSRLSDLKAQGWDFPAVWQLDGFRLGEHLGCLHRILDWAAAAGTCVVLVDMPVPAELDCVRHAREFARYRAALAELERTRGVRVLRASRAAVGVDDRHFADLIHLNADGARLLSDWIRRALEEKQ